MNGNKKELLTSYIKSNTAPILVDFIEGKDIPESVILPANCDISELNGYYENIEYKPPKWLSQILETKRQTILVIDKIDKIPIIEQTKFIEILKYRQVSTFELPKNTVIIVTAHNINEKTINEEIYSLVAHIKG